MGEKIALLSAAVGTVGLTAVQLIYMAKPWYCVICPGAFGC